MDGKSQVSIYLVISTAFILVIVAVFLLTSVYQKKSVTHMPDSSSISLAAKTCLDLSLSDAVTTVALNGGHFSSENYTGLLFVNTIVPYWMNDKLTFIPTSEELGQAINEELITLVDECLGNISAYYILDRTPPSVSTSVYEDYVSATLEPGLSVKTTFSVTKVPPIISELPARLGLMRDYASLVIADLNDSTETITMHLDSPFNVSQYVFNRDKIYVMKDYDENYSALTLQFVASPPLPLNTAPILSVVPTTYGNVGELLTVVVNATDDYGKNQLHYSIASFDNLDIDSVTGEISFTPVRAGSYKGIVTVIDGFYEEDSTPVIIEVSE